MLTPKQKQIFELLSRGLVQKEVADKLKMSHSAVEKHVKQVRLKFGGVTTIRAVVICLHHDLVSIQE